MFYRGGRFTDSFRQAESNSPFAAANRDFSSGVGIVFAGSGRCSPRLTSPSPPGLSCTRAAESIGRAVRSMPTAHRASPFTPAGVAGTASPAIAAGMRRRCISSFTTSLSKTRCGRSVRMRRRLPLFGQRARSCGERSNAGGTRAGTWPAMRCTSRKPCWRRTRPMTRPYGTPSRHGRRPRGRWTIWKMRRPVIWWRC